MNYVKPLVLHEEDEAQGDSGRVHQLRPVTATQGPGAMPRLAPGPFRRPRTPPDSLHVRKMREKKVTWRQDSKGSETDPTEHQLIQNTVQEQLKDE